MVPAKRHAEQRRRKDMKPVSIIGAVVVLVALLGAAAWHFDWFQRPAAPPPSPTAGAPSSPPSAAATSPEPGRAAEKGAPSFDVVRINPQGQAVIAGRAAPGAEVTILDGDHELGHVTADRNGEWVFMPSHPLPSGEHQLSLAARLPNGGETRKSDGVVAMVVPEHDQSSGSLAVLVPRDGGGPARALQLPREASGRKLTLDVIQYDANGKVQLFGRALAKAHIAIFVDDRRAAGTTANGAGEWTAQLDQPLPVGHYHLRCEATDDEGKALAQLALVFDRRAPPPGYAAVDIQPGNNLWRIAQRSYGDGLRYAEIYQANRQQIHDPNLIYPGQVFAVPAKKP
jgi:nucleoid-associated protein YgaU